MYGRRVARWLTSRAVNIFGFGAVIPTVSIGPPVGSLPGESFGQS